MKAGEGKVKMKIRFIEPSNAPYKDSMLNHFVYNKYIRTPSHGLMILAAVVENYNKEHNIDDDILIYSECIAKFTKRIWADILSADVVFISIFTFSAPRGYEIADTIKAISKDKTKVFIGGLHATLCYEESAQYCDYVMTGEGDEQILEVLSAIRNGNGISIKEIKGIAYKNKDGKVVYTGKHRLPENIDVIPARHLMYGYTQAIKHEPVWAQVHASRGCPHDCAYCALVAAFGRCMRKRSKENVIADLEDVLQFYKKNGPHRLANMLWITDDNFFADRKWAMEVLNAVIKADIARRYKYEFVIQARYEVGFDDEMLDLLKRAGFTQLAMGIEFLEDEEFADYNKKCTRDEVINSIHNIQSHGLNVRGLFIMGADTHTKGVGKKLANFVIEHNICGVLIQSMYFIPGTPVYETHKDKLLHTNWAKYDGNVVHKPEHMTPAELQQEIIIASKTIYSTKRIISETIKRRGVNRILFIGEYFWQWSVRNNLKKELKNLEKLGGGLNG